MLSMIALTAVLMQEPPAPPPPPVPEVRSRVVFLGGSTDGPGGLDGDEDGEVTREEFAAPLNRAFDRLDKNGDGRLSRDELAGGAGPDGDGVVVEGVGVRSFGLRRPGGERTMVFVSPDGEGPDSRVIVRARPGGGPRVMEFERGPGHPRPGRVEVRAVDGPHGRDLDKDGDGKISEAEFTAPLREAFARMDADRSGFIEDGERVRDGEVRVFTHRIETRDEE